MVASPRPTNRVVGAPLAYTQALVGRNPSRTSFSLVLIRGPGFPRLSIWTYTVFFWFWLEHCCSVLWWLFVSGFLFLFFSFVIFSFILFYFCVCVFLSLSPSHFSFRSHFVMLSFLSFYCVFPFLLVFNMNIF